jgi:hypothetical protein
VINTLERIDDMPRIPVHTVDSAPQASREVLAGLAETIVTHGAYDGRAREHLGHYVGTELDLPPAPEV